MSFCLHVVEKHVFNQLRDKNKRKTLMEWKKEQNMTVVGGGRRGVKIKGMADRKSTLWKRNYVKLLLH